MISKIVITTTIKKLAYMSGEDQMEALKKFREEQRAVFNFAYYTEDIFSEDERAYLFSVSITIWLLFTNSVKPMRKVSKAKLGKIHRDNYRTLHKMFDAPDADFVNATHQMIEQCSEYNILQYIIGITNNNDEYVLENDDPPSPIGEDRIRPVLIHLKTIMDAFITARLKYKKNNPISRTAIRAYWLSNPPEDIATQVYTEFIEAQPAIASYLLLNDSLFTKEERMVIFKIGLTIWFVMNEERERPLREVTQEELDKSELENFKTAEMVMTDSPADHESAIQTFLDDGPEPEITLFIIAVVMDGSGYQELLPIRDEHRGYAAHCVQTVFDALVAVRD